jgi:surfactin synthase thioesterase subunit
MNGMKMNLVCLSFAGGNKYSYRYLIEKAPSFLNIITLKYPGYGTRRHEPLISEQILEIISKRLNNKNSYE